MKQITVRLLFWVAVLSVTSGLTVFGQVYHYTDRQTGLPVYTNVQPTEQEAPELAAQLAAERKAAEAASRGKSKSLTASTPAVNPSQYNALIEKYADKHQVDPQLIKAVIRAESNFNAHAVSPKGAKGLMQLMPGTARRYGVSNIFDPEENIQGGTRYLRFLLDMFNEDVRHTVAAYNAGENAVLRVGGIPPYRETVEYVKRVTNFYGHEKHQIKPEPTNPFGVYVYREKDGSLLLTNVEPPRRQGN